MGISASDVAWGTAAVVTSPLWGPCVAGYAAGKSIYNQLHDILSKQPAKTAPSLEREYAVWRSTHNMAFDTVHWKHWMNQKIMPTLPEFDLDMYNMAFCGGVKAGKSSLLNAIRCLPDIRANTEQAKKYATMSQAERVLGPALVGTVECTNRPTRYTSKGVPLASLWDMPGAGTSSHPSSSYYVDKCMYAFDCIVLVSSGAILECDMHVIKGAVARNQPFAVVRTKCDVDIQNLMEEGESREGAILQIHRDVEDSFKQQLHLAKIAEADKVMEQIRFFFVSRRAFPIEGSNKRATEPCNDEIELIRWICEVGAVRQKA